MFHGCARSTVAFLHRAGGIVVLPRLPMESRLHTARFVTKMNLCEGESCHCDYCEMTDTTNSHDASATPTKTPPNNEVDSAVTGTAEGDGLVSIELSGCPNPVPRMLVHRNVIAEGRFKIPFRNGYDHFAFESYTTRDGQEIPVFVWTGRTRVAE